MVNSYLKMKKFYEAKNLTPRWTHWEFQESAAWGLLDRDGPPRRKIENRSTQLIVPRALNTLTATVRRAKMSEKTILPGGVHGVQLDRSMSHYPFAVAKDKKRTTVCQLHRLANKVINKTTSAPKGARDGVLTCADCGVALCITCFPEFHSIELFGVPEFCKILRGSK